MEQPGQQTVKGIVLAAFPYGEYGRRLSVLSDRFGKITVFAQGAAKPQSGLMGLTVPMTCAAFSLVRGKSAWNLRGASLIASFSERMREYETVCYGMYLLEVLSWFSQEGMEEGESKTLLNLTFCALSALAEGFAFSVFGAAAGRELIRRMYELRVLVTEGEYTEFPEETFGKEAAALWRHTVTARLSLLYREEGVQEICGKDGAEAFCAAVKRSFQKAVPHRFQSLEVLQQP